MSLARSSPSYGTQPYPTALLDIYRSIRLRYDLLPWIEVSFPYIGPLQEISSLAQGFLRRNTLIVELVYLIFDSTYEITVRLGVLFVTLAGGLVTFLVPSHLPHRHACAGATHCSTDGADNTDN